MAEEEWEFPLPTPSEVRAYMQKLWTEAEKFGKETQAASQRMRMHRHEPGMTCWCGKAPDPGPFDVGDEVEKRSGYAFDSTVVSVFRKLDGEYRVVCESHAIPGLLHIFSPNQIIKCASS